MSQDRFKPISDALRKALRALGETPEDHLKEQKEMKDRLLASKTTKKLQTKTLHQHNAEIFRLRRMSPEERRDEALRLEAKAAALRPEVPDARVLFIRDMRCTHCGTAWPQMDFATPFLRMRRVFSSGRLDLSSARYIPEHQAPTPLPPGIRLPKIIEHTRTEVSSCLQCFGHAVHSHQEISSESSTSPQDSPQATDSLEGKSESMESLIGSQSSEREELSGTLASHIQSESSSLDNLSGPSEALPPDSSSDSDTSPPQSTALAGG